MLKTNRELAYFLYRYSERQHFGAFSFFFIEVITTFNCSDLEMYFTIIRILQQLGQECLLNSIVNEQLVILNTESNIQKLSREGRLIFIFFLSSLKGSLEISKDFMKEICLTIEIRCVLWPSAVRLFPLLRLQLSHQNCNDSLTFTFEDLLCPMFHRKTGSTPRSGQKRSVH